MSRIFSPIRYDIFRFMDVNNRSYGYNHLQRDEIPVVTGLWTLADKWTRTHPTYARTNNIVRPAASQNANRLCIAMPAAATSSQRLVPQRVRNVCCRPNALGAA